MSRQIAQFRFFGDTQSSYNKTVISYQMVGKTNSDNLDSDDLIGGDFLAANNINSIIQLGIQALPGTQFTLNNSVDPIIIGISGIYEIDLEDSATTINTINFDKDSLDKIGANPDGYLIIDIVYEEE